MFQATAADVPAIAASLASAFDDDPVMMWVFPDDRTRPQRLGGLFEVLLRNHHLPHGEVWATDDRTAAAAWCQPDQWRIPMRTQLRNAPRLVKLIGLGLFTRLNGLVEAERHHPPEPHWYLSVLGVVPDKQRCGLGSELLRPMLERCDAEGMPAYLESSKESNLAFYGRHGFKVTEKIPLGKGPEIWGMWRDPK